ncbi:MAG: hypothetical protein O2923_07465 [Verrucomicrobia bacterium]|nr:hypothetical protein [Verrucomicrobiota bacterium]MDA1086971.1 hypothetical protein [Verrucomicrobiota bacterium]
MTALQSITRSPAPAWARLQRQLIDRMNECAVAFVERYTREDGSLVWRDEWPGMDGSDDGYESFGTFPLFYALGGSPTVHDLSRRQWSAVTKQFTAYGQVHREFDAYYDWMHHGESNLYLYAFGLADPNVALDRDRALRFAGMYMGQDAEACNWDAELRMIRSPITGSRGPRFEMTAEDWCTHRPVLADYLSPYEDVPGIDAGRDPAAVANWNDDAVFAEILKRMNARMAHGDVPLNLTATSLVTHAFLYTGEEKYRQWVLDYLDAWRERTEDNGGITPDNVGPTGRIGECMDGKWWGGYYGWRWPHGVFSILEPLLIAGTNAQLLTGDGSHLDLLTSQLDALWERGRVQDGTFKIPNHHGDAGWFAYHEPDSSYAIRLRAIRGTAEDGARLSRYAELGPWSEHVHFGKGGQAAPQPWQAFIDGSDPAYPERLMMRALEEVERRMEIMAHDDGDSSEWDVHHWQEINPVLTDPLVQLTMGAPGVVYHGGLCHAPIRHFDPVARRPGLPDDVSALVSRVQPESVELEVINLHPSQARELLVQAGAFGEHVFTGVARLDVADESIRDLPDLDSLTIQLAPSSSVHVRLVMRRFSSTAGYAFPWDGNR